MAVGLARHRIRQAREPARMRRGRAPREAGDGEVEGAPEQVDGRDLAENARSEVLEHAIDAHQRPVEALHGLAVVGPNLRVRSERHWIWHLVRAAVDTEPSPNPRHRLGGTREEVRDAHRLQREALALPTHGFGNERVIA